MAIQRLAIPSRDRRRYLLAIREQAYVADGIANEIRATLARNGALEVVGQASSEAFARRKDDAVVFAKRYVRDI